MKSIWSEDYIDSSDFKVAGYNNTRAPYASKEFVSQAATMGIFRIDISALVTNLTNSNRIPLTDAVGNPICINSSDMP